MNTETNTQPLYKVLNEKRTHGEWINSFNETKDIHYVYNDTKEGDPCRNLTVATFSTLIGEPKENAQYTALAVNNLHKLAEALDNFISSVDIIVEGLEDGERKNVYKSIQNSNTYKTAKAALQSIS